MPNTSHIFKAIKLDISTHALKSFVRNIKEKRVVYGEFAGQEEKCESIQDAIDYILGSFKVNSDKKYLDNLTIIDIDDYCNIGGPEFDLKEMANDYGFNSIYISAQANDVPNNYQTNYNKLVLYILISDKRYINDFFSKLKYLSGFNQNPGIIAGRIIFK